MGFAGTKPWEGGHEESMRRLAKESNKSDIDKLREEVAQLKREVLLLKELIMQQHENNG